MHHPGRLHVKLTVSRLMVGMRLWLGKSARPHWRFGRNRRVVIPYATRC